MPRYSEYVFTSQKGMDWLNKNFKIKGEDVVPLGIFDTHGNQHYRVYDVRIGLHSSGSLGIRYNGQVAIMYIHLLPAPFAFNTYSEMRGLTLEGGISVSFLHSPSEESGRLHAYLNYIDRFQDSILEAIVDRTISWDN